MEFLTIYFKKERKMYKIIFPTLVIASVSACDIKLLDNDNAATPDVSADIVEPAQFATFQRQSNGDVLLTSGDGEITIPAARFAEYEAEYGMRSTIFGDGDTFTVGVSKVTDNVELAAAMTITDTDGPRDIINFFSGISGEVSATPTTGTTNYAGAWVAGFKDLMDYPDGDYGPLTLNHDFSDNSITGTGTSDFNSGPMPFDAGPVFTVDGVANADGSISGTVTHTRDYGGEYGTVARVGDLDAGFFGENGEEIAGAFTGDGIGGILHAERGATLPDTPEAPGTGF